MNVRDERTIFKVDSAGAVIPPQHQKSSNYTSLASFLILDIVMTIATFMTLKTRVVALIVHSKHDVTARSVTTQLRAIRIATVT